MGSLIIVLLTTRSVAIPGAPHCRRWAEASGVATGARYAGTPVRLADKANVVKPPSAGEPLYCNAYLQVVSVKQALSRHDACKAPRYPVLVGSECHEGYQKGCRSPAPEKPCFSRAG